MKFIAVHQKQLPIPSFFQVYNYGGGNGDKDREITYSEFTSDTPALINYFYINNRYPHLFQSRYFDNLDDYNTIGDVYNNIRRKLISDKNEIYTGYNSPDYDFNDKVFLLDSGAFNIVKQIAANINYDTTKFRTTLIEHMKYYYDFADKLKMDVVVGFDLGGKYTEKDDEKGNKALNNFLEQINSEEINNMLLEETIKYISTKKEYYPYVLATIHGDTQTSYGKCVDYVLELEKKYNYMFWGFALGGIASYKKVDKSWYNDIDFSETGKRGIVETVTPARACIIVNKKIGDRPIHALGCGGYSNIAMNYYCGATSFDAASPVRRVGDGSLESTKLAYNPEPITGVGFSKYFIGGINTDNSMREESCSYVKLNEVKDSMKLCGCPACIEAGTIKVIKDLYAMKEKDDEANYFSRQLMGLHAVYQHRKLCERIAEYGNIESFCCEYPSQLNKGLVKIFKQL